LLVSVTFIGFDKNTLAYYIISKLRIHNVQALGVLTKNLLRLLLIPYRSKREFLSLSVTSTLMGAHKGLHSKGRLLALTSNISLGWRKLAMTNTLTYYYRDSIIAVKCFIVQAQVLNITNVCTPKFKKYMMNQLFDFKIPAFMIKF
jgi:hypothetical protein